MDSRGPPEGGPVTSFEISNIDKVTDSSVNWSTDHSLPSSMCDQPKKMSNKLLFLTVSKLYSSEIFILQRTIFETFFSLGGIRGRSI